ncbi:hypothetical protein ACX8Z9_04550 [Arthrobacter halodurans]|uniref:Uncharacterized protein n=1 Tax=Arthrobacter halodurans TaxID=516699 RepID=A0ABV4UPV8_9MICC
MEPTELSPEEQSFWVAHSGVDTDPALVSAALTHQAALAVAFVAEALDPVQAGERLGLDPADVLARQDELGLAAVDTDLGRLYPAWQFTATGLLPHLAEAYRVIPEGLHPRSVAGFFTTPQPELVSEPAGKPTTPRVWLEAGHSPAPVLRLAAHLGESI